MHTAPYFTAFGLLTLLHSFRVVGLRRKFRVSLGHGSNQELERRMRVFGNFTEYVPIGLVLLIGLEFVQAPTWYMHLAGVTLLLGRMAHAVGLGAGRLQPRAIGMVLTYLSLVLSSVGVSLFTFLSP